MARRTIRVERLIAVLGVAVLALGAVILWLATTRGLGRAEPTPVERAQAQLLRLVGPDARVSYTETGRRRAVCGYVSHGGQVTAFVSRPNRVLLATDPLKTEFEGMLTDLCPGFLRAPPRVP